MIRHFLTSLILAVIGCLMVWGGIYLAVSVARQKSWPRIEATILKSELTVSNTDDGPAIELQVRFLVDGIETQTAVYTCDFDTVGGRVVRHPLFDRIPERYAVGQTVFISYDPNNPEDALAEFDDSYFSSAFRILLVVLGLVLILASCTLEVTYLYVKFQQWKMRHHLEQARHLSAEGDSISAASDRVSSNSLVQEKRSSVRAQLDLAEALSRQVDEEVGIFESVFRGESAEEHPADSRPQARSRNESNRTTSSSRSGGRQMLKTNRLREAIICVLFATSAAALSSWFAPYHVVTLRCLDEQTVNCHIQRVLFGILPIGKPQVVTDVREVVSEFRGRSRTQSGFLAFSGTEKITIPAGHAILSEKRIREYLAAPSGRLLLSDGRIIFGLYLPWITMLWGVFLCVPLWADWKALPDRINHPLTSPQRHDQRLSAVTRFGLAAMITWCAVWGMALVVQDIYHTNIYVWLLLLILSVVGGMVNLWWTDRQWSKKDRLSVC